MHSRPYRGPQSEIIRREPLFLIRGSGEAHFCATRLVHVKEVREGVSGDASRVKCARERLSSRSAERKTSTICIGILASRVRGMIRDASTDRHREKNGLTMRLFLNVKA